MLFLLALAVCTVAPTIAPLDSPALKVETRRIAPVFTLADLAGKKRSLSQYRGRPVALFFFCGCSWCTECAEEWGPLQRGGALPAAPAPAKPPITLVVYSGDNTALRYSAARWGLDKDKTVLLPDPGMRVTKVYKADPCPRVFILDGEGVVRYTNDHKDDRPREAPALVIVSRTIDALRSAAAAGRPSGKGKARAKT